MNSISEEYSPSQTGKVPEGRIGLITTDEVRLYDFSIRSLFEQTSPSYFYQIFVRTEFVYFLDR